MVEVSASSLGAGVTVAIDCKADLMAQVLVINSGPLIADDIPSQRSVKQVRGKGGDAFGSPVARRGLG
jgi:hypothetical protein